jgi:hypothetical protein
MLREIWADLLHRESANAGAKRPMANTAEEDVAVQAGPRPA